MGCFWFLTSTFALDHCNLFGLTQGLGIDIYDKLGFGIGNEFKTRLHYAYCRHPIMWGFFMMHLAAPVMTYGHAFFAFGTISYIVIAVKCFEEPDL